jgi:predicted DNA binding CopG/RHH family protein
MDVIMTRAKDVGLVKVSLFLRKIDVKRARSIASGRGIGYQTLLRQLVQTALEREIANSGKLLLD